MAKKRRDRERDSSSIGKISKVGAAALSVGVGAAAFTKAGYTKKLLSQVAPAAIGTTRAIKKDLATYKALKPKNKKGIKMQDIYNVYTNHFKEINTFKEELSKRGTNKVIKLNNVDKKLSLVGQLRNFYENKNTEILKELKKYYKAERQNHYIQEVLAPKYADKNQKLLFDIAGQIFHQVDEYKTINKDGSLSFGSFVDKKINMIGLNKEKDEIIEAIYKEKEKIDEFVNSNKFEDVAKYAKDFLVEKAKEKLLDGLKEEDKAVFKMSQFFNKKLGSNLDIEESLLGSKALTVNQFLSKYRENPNMFDSSSLSIRINLPKGKTQDYNIVNELDSLVKENPGFGDVILDNSLRIDEKGNIFDISEIKDILKEKSDKSSSNIVNSLFWHTDMKLRNNAASFTIMNPGSTAKEAGFEIGNKTTSLRKGKAAIGNSRTQKYDLYELELDFNGKIIVNETPIEEGGFLNPLAHGKTNRLYRQMIGSNMTPINVSDSLIAKKLDIKQSGIPDITDRLSAKIGKNSNPDWGKNILQRSKALTEDMDVNIEDKIDILAREKLKQSGLDITIENLNDVKADFASVLLKDIKYVSSSLNNYTALNQVDDTAIEVLKVAYDNNIIEDKFSKKLLDIISNDNFNEMDIIKEISVEKLNDTSSYMYNKDLENIVYNGLSNADSITHLQNISQIKPYGLLPEATNVMTSRDVLRREIVKEVLLRETSQGLDLNKRAIYDRRSLEKMEDILQFENFTKEQSNNLRYIANWGLIQSNIELYNDTDKVINLSDIIGENGTISRFESLINESPHFKKEYRKMLDTLDSNFTFLDEGVIGNINETYKNEYNNYAYMRRSALNIDNLTQIKDINDAIKLAGQVKDELLAGRHDLKNYTTLTQVSQFMVARLDWGVQEFGLGLSNSSTGSTLDMIKNIALKRVLPAAAIFSAYDYLNFESENLTGVSITGAAANTASNIDIASRKLAYATGIGQAIDWFKDSSVLAEYWTGSSDFQTAEERQDWYENGYSAVRGGRFWGFGSTSEYRGSAIQYYQPNYLKRAHSNWDEIGTYGSAEEKFKHSWLPSLRYPLSPIRALMDPYWLEKKNMEDRPYPLTGKMFSEGTPWGAVLNPTVGQILKPVKMLPEVEKRLGSDGRDIRTVLEGINNRIKSLGNENDDMLIVRGTDIRNATYVPFASPNDGSLNLTFENGSATASGINYMDEVLDFEEYSVPNGQYYDNQEMPFIKGDGEIAQTVTQLAGQIQDTSKNTQTIGNQLIGAINQGIKNISNAFALNGGVEENSAFSSYAKNLPNLQNGTYVYQNLVNQRKVFNSNYYADNFDYSMVDKSLVNNFMKDFTGSVRELSGIYNFLGELAFGEDSFSFEFENANAMTSFSRRFWDLQAGGLGGEVMEIARRFFASEDKSRIKYNPLRNSMDDWLPSRFLTGDPYAELPKGEMRLPGKGYESLNQLHPDKFGTYGAFDRMKILGDVAPTSEEYKIWRNIARNTITDPNLIKQMDDIEERAKKMSSKHEFYEYRYFNNNLDTKTGVVKSWDGNIVTLASGEKLRLGGINLNEYADLTQVISTGDKIHYASSKDAVKRLEDGLITNAVIYKKSGGMTTNVNKSLVDLGMATRDEQDKTAIGYTANTSSIQQAFGMIQEIIGHAQIPFIHNKYMKIETARESFINEQIYGTGFSTWDHPIRGFVKPLLNKTFGQTPLEHAAAIGSTALFFKLKQDGAKGLTKWGSAALMATANPAALLGAGIEFGTKLGMTAIGGGSSLLNVERGAKIGSIVGTIGWGLANAENPLKAMTSFAVAGEVLNRYLETSEVVDKAGRKVFSKLEGKGALIGAGVGLTISAIKNPGFSKDMFRKRWVPKETEKKWELDEYFDRLEYIKNKGLYEQAALRAGIFEGNHTIKATFRKLDKNKKKIAKLTKKAEKLSNKHSAGGYEYEQEMAKINKQIMALNSQQTVFKGGKYTKAAIAYKKAMDSTLYGLSEGATSDEILAAIPVQYKDHFKAFLNETSKSERKKILKSLPEYLRRPLQIAWNEKVDKVDDNKKFFRQHKLPHAGWKGWKPNINLKHVKMKTIQNEGMLLSDFGYYDSEKSKMEYAMAPGIDNFDSEQYGGLRYLSNMTAALSGIGMTVQNISVEPTSSPGLWIVGDIKQTVKDVSKIGEYAIDSGIQTLTSLLF